MQWIETMEERFFHEGPRFCLQGAGVLFVTGLMLSSLGAVFADEGPWYTHFSFALLMAIPAFLLLLLSVALQRRHIATIPLVLGLIGFSIRYILVTPTTAFEGIETGPLHFAVGWAAFGAQIIAAIGAAAFMWYLWKKRAFE